MYRFLLSGKWIAAFVLTVLFSLLCVYLAGWQMDRKDALDYRNSRISQNYDATPLSQQEGEPYFSAYDPDREWTPVRLTGTYLVQDQLLVRNRPHNGSVGFEVLTPLRLQDGTVVVVDRGWMAAGDSNAAPVDAVPAPPGGTVEVVVRLKAGEDSTSRDAPAGQIPSVDLRQVAERVAQGGQNGTAVQAYGILDHEDPAPATRPEPLSAPEQDNGPNLSYSLQWYAFAVLAYVAYAWCARQKVRNDKLDAQLAEELDRYYRQFYAEDGTYIGELDESVVRRQMEMIDDMPPHMKAIVRPKPPRARKRPTDAEEEDALLDGAVDDDGRAVSGRG